MDLAGQLRDDPTEGNAIVPASMRLMCRPFSEGPSLGAGPLMGVWITPAPSRPLSFCVSSIVFVSPAPRAAPSTSQTRRSPPDDVCLGALKPLRKEVSESVFSHKPGRFVVNNERIHRRAPSSWYWPIQPPALPSLRPAQGGTL